MKLQRCYEETCWVTKRDQNLATSGNRSALGRTRERRDKWITSSASNVWGYQAPAVGSQGLANDVSCSLEHWLSIVTCLYQWHMHCVTIQVILQQQNTAQNCSEQWNFFRKCIEKHRNTIVADRVWFPALFSSIDPLNSRYNTIIEHKTTSKIFKLLRLWGACLKMEEQSILNVIIRSVG